jgi:hypothetical protein
MAYSSWLKLIFNPINIPVPNRSLTMTSTTSADQQMVINTDQNQRDLTVLKHICNTNNLELYLDQIDKPEVINTDKMTPAKQMTIHLEQITFHLNQIHKKLTKLNKSTLWQQQENAKLFDERARMITKQETLLLVEHDLE